MSGHLAGISESSGQFNQVKEHLLGKFWSNYNVPAHTRTSTESAGPAELLGTAPAISPGDIVRAFMLSPYAIQGQFGFTQ